VDLRREKLLERISGAAQAQLVLVHAPAGYGKSTLLRQLAQQELDAGGKVGWITPMSQDADISRLVQLFSAACERLLQEGDTAPPPTRDLPALLGAIKGPALFLLDEYDHFAGAETDTFLARLIERLPPGIRIAIASRIMPDLAAARLKLSGRAVVLGSVDLRFDLGEAHLFFAERPGVGAEEVRRLHSRLDGWPAAFQFISLALQSPGCPPSDALGRAMAKDMVEYLAQEVFALQSEKVQRLLLDACLPDRISASLLTHIMVDAEDELPLDALWAAGLFLDPVDGDRHWYRFHPLFGDFLRARYRGSVSAAELAQRHRLIADWFAANAMTEAAVDHYLAADAQAEAADLLSAIARRLVSEERLGLLLSLIERLEPEIFLARPSLVSHAIIAYGFRRNFGRAHHLLDWIQQHEPDVPPEVQAEREVQRCYILAAEDHVEDMGGRARDAAKWLGPDRPFFHGVALNAYAFWLTAQSQFTEAADLMLRARPLHEEAENYFGGSYAESILASTKMSQGLAEESCALLSRSLQRVEQEAPSGTWAGAVIAAHLGDARYETNRLAEARTVIEKYLPFIQQQCIVDPLCLSTVALARIAALEGDAVKAHELYESLITAGHKYGLERLVACGRAELVREATLAGDIEAAERRMRAVGTEARLSTEGQLIFASGETEAQRITYLRLLVHSGRHAEARAGLQGEIRIAGVRRRIRRLARLKTLLAICLEKEGTQPLARRTIMEAASHAASGGMMRVILDEGPAAMRLLNELAAENLAQNVKWAEDPIADWVRRLVDIKKPAHEESAAAPDQPIETLTPREQDLLRFLALGHSNTDLSDRLAVSENTIKFHLRNIYAKLNVSNRMQAVQAARHFRLIKQ
jgi:LuxR family transcriptional regulator, maltose regulon positive regulatory protein